MKKICEMADAGKTQKRETWGVRISEMGMKSADKTHNQRESSEEEI